MDLWCFRYRAKIQKVETGKATVLFIDFGNVSILTPYKAHARAGVVVGCICVVPAYTSYCISCVMMCVCL